MKKNREISINKTLGVGLIIIGGIINYLLIERFFNQGFFDGKTYGTIYEYNINFNEWFPSILYSILIIISGILIIKTRKLNNLLLLYTLIGIIIDRVLSIILFNNETLNGTLIDIITPIIIALTLIVYMNYKREEVNRIRIKNYSLAIFIGTIITISSNIFLK